MSGDGQRRPLRLVATVVEALVALATVAFLVMLFANEPAPPPSAAGGGGGGGSGTTVAAGGADGAAIFADNCASCHGADAGGGIGPKLSDGAVVAAFPDEADQVTFVTDGAGGMPSFGDRLSAEEITAVVAYTRTL